MTDVVAIEKERPIYSKTQYRPIFILDTISKIDEKVICEKYKSSVQNQFTNQHAYVNQGSTTNALISMLNDWTVELDKDSSVCICVLLADFSKAFDKMSHSNLLQKQSDLDIHPELIKLTASFLQNRKQVVTNYRIKPAESSE